jgi:hypothetical protein
VKHNGFIDRQFDVKAAPDCQGQTCMLRFNTFSLNHPAATDDHQQREEATAPSNAFHTFLTISMC